MGTTRRGFIKAGVIAGAGMTVAPSLSFGMAPDKDKVRIGFIGVGNRGRSHLDNFLWRDDVIIPALCDIDPFALERSKELFRRHECPVPDCYTGNDYAFMDLVERKDLDGVVISTPWLWHTRMALASMKAGKHVGLEVPAANTLEECWDLVSVCEETGKHCMILENVCYSKDVMAVLRMVREGLFGELLHARCGYQHDLRAAKFSRRRGEEGATLEFGPQARGEARWRTEHSLRRNGDLYPTHGAGPVAVMLDINRGNRFVSLTSSATKSRGLHDYIVNNPAGGREHPAAGLAWKLGDIVTSTISTARGETILVTHDTSLPRPYSLGFRIQGVKGLAEFDIHGQRIYVEGLSQRDKWESMESYYQKFNHPLWQRWGGEAAKASHGGMDFFVAHAFAEFIKRGDYPPMDVYDAAAWSAIAPLSEASVANNGEPQIFPDFTRGRWITNPPVFAIKNDMY